MEYWRMIESIRGWNSGYFSSLILQNICQKNVGLNSGYNKGFQNEQIFLNMKIKTLLEKRDLYRVNKYKKNIQGDLM